MEKFQYLVMEEYYKDNWGERGNYHTYPEALERLKDLHQRYQEEINDGDRPHLPRIAVYELKVYV